MSLMTGKCNSPTIQMNTEDSHRGAVSVSPLRTHLQPIWWLLIIQSADTHSACCSRTMLYMIFRITIASVYTVSISDYDLVYVISDS